MNFYNLDKKLPQEGMQCVIKTRDYSDIQTWYDDDRFRLHPHVVTWGKIPDHININPAAWKSDYKGDDHPGSGWCLVSLASTKVIKMAFYDAKLDRFLGWLPGDVLGYIAI